jgi:hypothetical protein
LYRYTAEEATEAAEEAALAVIEKEAAKQIQSDQISANRIQGTTSLANAAREMVGLAKHLLQFLVILLQSTHQLITASMGHITNLPPPGGSNPSNPG